MSPEYFYPLLGMGFAFGFGILGTVRWYLKQKLQAQAGQVGRGDDDGVRRLEGRVAELEERLDFAERLLARGSERREG